jgi:hypothetical protein
MSNKFKHLRLAWHVLDTSTRATNQTKIKEVQYMKSIWERIKCDSIYKVKKSPKDKALIKFNGSTVQPNGKPVTFLRKAKQAA